MSDSGEAEPETILDEREVASRTLDALASSSLHPVSTAIQSLSRFTRAEWPETDELPGIVSVAEALTQLESSSSATLEEAISHAKEAEAARASASAVLQQMITVVDSPPSGELSTLRSQVAALESQLLNTSARGERLSQEILALRRENIEVRLKQASADTERESLQRRVDSLEYSLAHVQKILEAAAGFASSGSS